MQWQHVHTYSGLWFRALRFDFAPVTAFAYFAWYGTSAFSSLVCFSALSQDIHIYCTSCVEFGRMLHSFVIQQNMRSHSLFCYTFCILVSALACYNTHMSFFVVVLHGNFCIYNSWFCVILLCLVCTVPVRCICWYQILMYRFLS